MNREDRKELYALIEQHTRCEIMARLCPSLLWTEWGDYSFRMIETMDKIRELMYGTSNLMELGGRWGLVERAKEKKRRNMKKFKLKK